MFCYILKNGLNRTYVLNDVATANMLQNHCVLRVHFMVELKSGRDLRQHRLLKIVATLARQLHFDVFRHNFKNVLKRVSL